MKKVVLSLLIILVFTTSCSRREKIRKFHITNLSFSGLDDDKTTFSGKLFYSSIEDSINNLVIELFNFGYESLHYNNYDEKLRHYLHIKEILEKHDMQNSAFYPRVIRDVSEFYILSNQSNKAILTYEDVLERYKKLHGKEHANYATILVSNADLFFEMYNFDEALKMYIEAIEIIEVTLGKESSDYTRTLTDLANFYAALGLFENALQLHIEAYEIIGKIQGRYQGDYLSSLIRMIEIYEMIGNYDNSMPLRIEGVEIVDNVLIEYHPEYAVSVNSSTKLLSEVGSNEKVSVFWLTLLRILEKSAENEVEKRFFRASSLSKVATLFRELGQYNQALILNLAAIEMLEPEHQLDEDYAEFLYDLAEVYYEMGRLDEALPLYFEVLEIRKMTNGASNYDHVKLLRKVADLYIEIDKFDESLSLIKEAHEIIKERAEEKGFDYALSLSDLANMYSKIGRFDQALSMRIEALEIIEQIFDKENLIYAGFLSELGGVYSEMNDFEQALSCFFEAHDIIKMVTGDESIFLEWALTDLAIEYSNIGKYEKALPLLTQARELIFLNISKNFYSLPENEKFRLLNTSTENVIKQQSIFRKYASNNAEISAATYNIELATKGMIQQSGIQMRLAILNSDDEVALQKFDEWFLMRASLTKQYALSVDERSYDFSNIKHRAERLESELNRLSNTFKEAQSIGSIKWQDVQQQLGKNEVAIEFASFQHYKGRKQSDSIFYTANVLRPGDEHPHLFFLCEQRQLDSLLFRQGNTEPAFIEGLYRGAKPIETSMPANGQRLYELIWKPIAHLLPEGATVYFAPAGSLHQIAHAAIPVGEDTLLLDKYKLVQLSTTAALLQQEDQNNTLTGEIVLFGGIQYDMSEEELIARSALHEDFGYQLTQRGIPAGLERSAETWSYLPGTLAEVEAIGKLAASQGMEVTSYTGKEALEDRFKELTGKNSPTILHIATHGFFFPDPQKEPQRDGFMMMDQEKQMFRASDNPLNRAGLLFAGANLNWQGNTMPEGVDDGILTAWEATNVTLMNTRLVTLSACETGLGEVRGSEGVFGLQRAFKAAGAGYLLMSLWKVPDHETAEFMTYFYARLFEGSNIRDAFHATQRHMKTQYPAEPYKWAAFVLTR